MMNDYRIHEARREHIGKYKIGHMVGVAEYMRERAEDYGIDPNVAYTMGLLHDVGYLEGRAGHEEAGAAVLSQMGMDSRYTEAIRLHGSNPYELRKTIGDSFITPEYILTLEADMSITARGFRVGFEGRLADIERRYGTDHAAAQTVRANIAFIEKYWEEHGIENQQKLLEEYDNFEERR